MSDLKDFVIENGVLTSYVGGGEDVVIPDGVTMIGRLAFLECKSLKSIAIPDSVTSIGSGAFMGCKSLKSIAIPDSVTSIGNEAFMGCESLKSIAIPDSVTSIGNEAFMGCESLTSIIIPNNVTSIGDKAFNSCINLTNIAIPDSVTSIGDKAFCYCTNLTAITIPESVTSIGTGAFDDTGYYNNSENWVDDVLYIGKNLIKKKTSNGSKKDDVCVIKDGTRIIANFALYGCFWLTSITIPDTVTNIGTLAFCKCEKLTSITIPDGVKKIGDWAFSSCSSLTSITFPESLVEIGEEPFQNCHKIQSINLPTNIVSFENIVFKVVWDCFIKTEYKLDIMSHFLINFTNLVINNKKLSQKIKANKRKIFEQAMKTDNAELVEKLFSLYKTIALDELNEYIEKVSSTNIKSFLLNYKKKNYSIEKQEKHENVKFEKELGLKERSVADWKKTYQFTLDGETLTITGYKGTDANIIVPEKIGKYKVVAIEKEAFSPYAPRLKEEQKQIRKNIETIVISKNITNIGQSAFSNCTSLVSVVIPDSVTSIGDYAFRGCNNLTIYASAGSYAEQYAKENNIPFIAE